MELYWQIMEFIWTWYLPGFILSVFTIKCWLEDFNRGELKILHLFISLILAFLGWIMGILALTGLLVTGKIVIFWNWLLELVPKSWKEFFNSEL